MNGQIIRPFLDRIPGRAVVIPLGDGLFELYRFHPPVSPKSLRFQGNLKALEESCKKKTETFKRRSGDFSAKKSAESRKYCRFCKD